MPFEDPFLFINIYTVILISVYNTLVLCFFGVTLSNYKKKIGTFF